MNNTETVVNMNDYIFKQNLQFYPNLRELRCEDNVITYAKDGVVVASEPLTFDLRDLPGNVWLGTPTDFINIIRLNKSCKALYSFLNIMEMHSFDTFVKPMINEDEVNKEDSLSSDVARYMSIYFNAKENSSYLTSDNNALLIKVDNKRAELPENSVVKTYIDSEVDNYYATTKELGGDIGKAAEIKDGPKLALVKKEEHHSYKAAYVNVAILIYGLLNIGIILAIALLKR